GRPGLAVEVGIVALLAVVARASRIRIPTTRQPRALGNHRLPKTYRRAWALLVCTGSVEVCLNLWVADVLRTHTGATPGLATAALSAIVAGMCVGRVVGGRLVLRAPVTRVLLGAFGVSAVGFAVFWLSSVPWLAVAGLVVLGLGNSMHFP